MASATYNPVADQYYVMDANENSWAMHVVDPANGKSLEVASNAAGVPLWDMEYSTWLSTEDAAKINAIYYYYLLPGKDPKALDTSAFGLQSLMSQHTGGQYLTAITSAGYYPFPEDDGSITDTELVIMLDNAGYIWYFWIYPTAEGFSANLSYVPTDLDINFPGDDTGNYMYSSMVVGEDGNLYLSAFTGATNELYCLTLSEDGEMYNATRIGDVGADIWPATITSVTVNDAEAADSIAVIDAIDTISTENFTAADLAAASVVNTAATCAMTAEARAQKELNAVKVEEPEAVDSTVTFEITADVLTTNGIMDITWDAEALELVNFVTSIQYTSKIVSDNSIVFGYVDVDGIEAGEVIATATFNAKSDDLSSFNVVNRELNDGIVVEEPVEVIASGWSGYTTWELTSDGQLTFTATEQTEGGQTNMKNYWKVNGVLTLPWGEYADQITKVVINEGINDIGQMAFYELPNLTEVVLPESAVEIRDYAFKNCKSLTTINLEVVENICEGAFYGCSALEDVTFAADVTIGDFAFSRTNIELP